MRINKIILFPVVILLLTVSFAGIAAAAPSEVGATIGTQLNATASVTKAPVNTPFTINGTLSENTSGAGISGQIITLQNSTDNATWSNVTTTTTNSSGFYQFSQSEPDAGLYYYRTTYDNNTVYSNAISLVVTVQVRTPTTLTATANVTSTKVNTPFTINGTLSVTGGAGIYGQSIALQQNKSGTWTNVLTSTTTDTNGNYSFSISESAPGAYQFQTTYAGDSNLFPATSAVVPVNVRIPTTLTATVNVTSTKVNTPFTINGTLSVTGGAGISGQSIALQQNESGTWTNVLTPTTTDTNGNYSFSISESAPGAYQFQTTYTGTSSILPATSNVVSVNVPSGLTTTTLTVTPSVTSTTVNTTFTISGTLSNATSGGIAGAVITLNGTNKTTDSNGNYSFSLSESTLGAYQFQTTYAGNATYTNATSNTVSVNVTTPPVVVTPISSAAATGNYLFVAGNDSALWYKTWNGAAWSNATSLGGVLATGSGPAATSSGGTTYVFAHGTDNAVWYMTSTGGTSGGWSGWHSLGGVLAAGSSPAATSGSSAIDVFAHGTDNAVWSRTITSGWNSLGGVLATGSSPAATSPTSGVIDVFAHGTDNAVWYRTTTSGGWHSLGGVLAAGSGPAATSSGSVAYVFAHGTNGAVYVKTITSGWTSLGGVLAAGSSPAATSSTGVIDVFALGTNNAVWQTTTTSSGVWTSTGPW
jgi:hypothetical protein